MTRAWPAAPLLILLLGICAGMAALWLWVWPVRIALPPPAPGPVADSVPHLQDQTAAAPSRFPPVAHSTAELLAAPPFSSPRRAFSREIPAETAAPQYDPRFIGLVRQGGKVSALVIWNSGEEERAHSPGEETPWGTLISAKGEALVFRDDTGERTLTLY